MARRPPNPVDKYVGGRIRTLRLLKGFSQEILGKRLKISFQQVQKYEKGTNRVGSGRLSDIATILGVSVAAFFEGAPGSGDPKTMGAASDVLDMLTNKRIVELLKAVRDADDDVLKAIILLAEKMPRRTGANVVPYDQRRRATKVANGRR